MTEAGSCESEGRILCVVAHVSRGALQARARPLDGLGKQVICADY
jgi:hypothetical protein